MKFHEQTNQNKEGEEMQLPKMGIQYNGLAGDADVDVMDQSSSQMVSQVRQEDSNRELENSGNNNEINFYAHQKNDTEVSTSNNTAVLLKAGNQVEKSRNRIMNDGKQLSLMTVNSHIMDNSADLLFDHFVEDSKGSQKDDEDEYLTFQLCEGEEMNNEMANFIGIHMLNDGYIEGDDQEQKPDNEGGLTY